MAPLISCIEELQLKQGKHKNTYLKETPTRAIFIDPLLEALGWDIRDPDEVELEYPTIDGKSVDYAAKINRKPVLFIEAKPLNDTLSDVKDITQVVGYAANAGVEWCILTNGITYKIYRSTEKADAPNKLLYEVTINPKETTGMNINQIAERFERFSKEAMATNKLDEIGEQIFTTSKVRKALDKFFLFPPDSFIKLIRDRIGKESITPGQVRTALRRVWGQSSDEEIPSRTDPENRLTSKPEEGKAYDEEHHTKGKPQEVVELYRTVDKFCRELDPNKVKRRYRAKYIGYSHIDRNFCSLNLLKSGLRVWLRLDYKDLENPPEYVRDVSNVGHWGTGDVELSIDSLERFQSAKYFIQKSFNKNKLL
jgi:hypothetical protein